MNAAASCLYNTPRQIERYRLILWATRTDAGGRAYYRTSWNENWRRLRWQRDYFDLNAFIDAGLQWKEHYDV